MVEPEPSWPLHRNRVGVRGNHFQVDVGAESQQQIVRGHAGMRSACTGPHTEGRLDVGRASLQTWRDNCDVIEASNHG